ncbi:glycosyl hydrolase family 61-domain-containing protein [Aspergillus crustosus]
MFSFPTITGLAAFTFVTTVSAHGYISSITIDGTLYPGFIVEQDAWGPAPTKIAWSTTATDQGFVADIHSPDIICHEGATPGALSAPVAAGGAVSLQWSSSWPDDHYGPVLTYLASCNGDCTAVDKNTLKFFKIDEAGLQPDGTWGSDKLVAQGKKWDVTIPAGLKAGGYVLRHEMIALHSKYAPQPYPQCINLEVTGGGSEQPVGIPGPELYKSDEPGMSIDIWQMDKSQGYKIPGPVLFSDTHKDAPPPEESTTTPPPMSTETTFTTLVSPPPTETGSSTLPPESTTYNPDPTSTQSGTETDTPTACPADSDPTTTTEVPEAPTETPPVDLAGAQIADVLPQVWRLTIQDVQYSCSRAAE